MRYEKKKLPLTNPPKGVGMSTPVGGAHMHMGDLKVSPCAPGPKVPVKKKKKNISNFGQNYLKIKLNVRLKVDFGW